MNPNPTQYQGPQLNQTQAIISLILGIASIVICGGLPGPVALILGYMARKKAMQQPSIYGGEQLALVGMITGAIGSVILVIVFLYLVLVFGIVGISLLTN